MKKFLSALLVVSMMFTATACSKPKVETPTPETPAVETPATETPTAETPANETPFKVAMITDVGGVEDQSFNQSAWEGLKKAEADYGAQVKYLESAQEANYVPNIDKLTDEHPDLIWGIGYMMADPLLNAAKQNPEQKYAIIDFAYDETPSNVTGVVFRAEEPSFLVGYLAAKTTKTDKIGFVGGIKGTVIDQFEFGYRAGAAYAAKELGKNIEVMVQYANSFADDAAGKAIATSMYTNGADIVFHAAGHVGVGVIEAAKETGKFVIGVDRDQSDLAPDNVITSSMKFVGDAMYIVSKELKDGQDIGGKTLSFGIKEGAAGIPDNDSTKKLVDPQVYSDTIGLQQLIVDGTIAPPSNEEAFNAYVETLK